MRNFINRILLSLMIFAFACTAFAADETPAPFKIATRRENDKVEVAVEKDRTIFSIRSPFGISHATIARTQQQWPNAVVLRLYLGGMESFQTSNGKVTLKASASIQNANVRVWIDDKEKEPLDSKSPYWMQVKTFGSDGKPVDTVLLKGGYFEITLPKAFFADNPKSIDVDWIDFYR